MESFATLRMQLLDRRAWKTIAELRTVVFHFIEPPAWLGPSPLPESRLSI